MKLKPLVALIVAAGFGLVAMLGVMQVMNGPGKEPTVKALVATADIPSGMPLDETNVEFKEFPQSSVPSGAVTREDEYAGKCMITRAVPGEIIMTQKLGGADAITASHQIPKGMRVATVSVDATKSHSGLIRPTDRVDVVCTYEVENRATRTKTTYVKTVLEFIEVFAVDNVRAGREGEVDTVVKNVSLLINPEQFQLLKAAEDTGELDLSLRNREDTDKIEISELSDEIFHQQDTSAGDRNATSEAPRGMVPTPAAPPTAGLGDFLASAVGAATVAAPNAAPVAPRWTMTICRGENVADVEVLDETALPETLSPAERQRIRAEARSGGFTETAGPKTQAAAPPGLKPEPTPSPEAPATPAEAPPAAAAPTEPAAQTAAKPAAPPALIPFGP